MRRGFGWFFVSAWLFALPAISAGCTGRAEAVRAAQGHLENFGELRLRTLKLLELRSDVALKRALLAAVNGDEDSLPDNLEPLLERLRQSGTVISQEQVENGEEIFWRMFDFTFSQNPNVLQAEVIYIEKDESVSSLRHPRESEIPVGVSWHGLRESRTFAGLTRCVTDEGSEPCVILQLRPRDYPGSAGLTVAYRRTPIEVIEESDSSR